MVKSVFDGACAGTRRMVIETMKCACARARVRGERVAMIVVVATMAAYKSQSIRVLAIIAVHDNDRG